MLFRKNIQGPPSKLASTRGTEYQLLQSEANPAVRESLFTGRIEDKCSGPGGRGQNWRLGECAYLLRDRVRLGEPLDFEGLRAFVFRPEAVLRFAALFGLALRAATLRATALPLRLLALFSLPLRALVFRATTLVLRALVFITRRAALPLRVVFLFALVALDLDVPAFPRRETTLAFVLGLALLFALGFAFRLVFGFVLGFVLDFVLAFAAFGFGRLIEATLAGSGAGGTGTGSGSGICGLLNVSMVSKGSAEELGNTSVSSSSSFSSSSTNSVSDCSSGSSRYLLKASSS